MQVAQLSGTVALQCSLPCLLARLGFAGTRCSRLGAQGAHPSTPVSIPPARNHQGKPELMHARGTFRGRVGRRCGQARVGAGGVAHPGSELWASAAALCGHGWHQTASRGGLLQVEPPSSRRQKSCRANAGLKKGLAETAITAKLTFSGSRVHRSQRHVATKHLACGAREVAQGRKGQAGAEAAAVFRVRCQQVQASGFGPRVQPNRQAVPLESAPLNQHALCSY
jgi:hypothetical protein